jgi:hypothetical protein
MKLVVVGLWSTKLKSAPDWQTSGPAKDERPVRVVIDVDTWEGVEVPKAEGKEYRVEVSRYDALGAPSWTPAEPTEGRHLFEAMMPLALWSLMRLHRRWHDDEEDPGYLELDIGRFWCELRTIRGG